ncbi:hypothetical protein [Roseibium marinum]|uniref:Patatin-like phospholipase n=1 Tax=Roseibium marinum TaxID=281252 RepID=A0A2S3UNF1_9HYPH|nr:hypothetical protein [Roseibium marinum]POF29029.1 hypothetical protein CLV41_11033 [Roseibium marinum]
MTTNHSDPNDSAHQGPKKDKTITAVFYKIAAWLADVTKTVHLLRAQIIIVLISIFLLSYEQTIDEYRALYSNVFEPVYAEKRWISIVTLLSSTATLFVFFPFTIWFTSRWLTNRNDNGSCLQVDLNQDYRSENDTRSWTRRWLPRILAVAPLLTVAYAAWKSGQITQDKTLYIPSLFCVSLSAAWIYLLFARTRHGIFSFVSILLEKEFRDLRYIFLTFLVVNIFVILNFGITIPQTLGILTYGVGFFIVILIFATYLAWGHMRTKVPYMILLGLWTAFLAYYDWTNNHEVEPLLSIDADNQPLELHAAFDAWLNHKTHNSANIAADQEIPVFIVAAAGGGIYAAQNAAFFLSKLDDSLASEGCGLFSKHVFAVSGVSGGSVGAALHGALLKNQLIAMGKGKKCANEEALLEPKLFKILNEDLLAPIVANFVTLDYPQRFLPTWPISFPDRAIALENAILSAVSRHEDGSRQYLENAASLHWKADSGLPALVLNTTELNSGRTVASSPFKLHGRYSDKNRPVTGFPQEDATFREILAKRPERHTIYKPMENCSDHPIKLTDTQRFEKNRDLSLIQAAVLSARFPYASPAGALTRLTLSSECANTEEGKTKQFRLFAAETQYIDGGYVESSGTEQALRIVTLLRDHVQFGCPTGSGESMWCKVKIHMITINLRTDRLISDTSYGLGLTPPMGLLKTWSQRSQTSREVASEYFNPKRSRSGIGKLHVIEPYDAFNEIPLGWRLSEKNSEKLQNFLCDGQQADKMLRLLKLVSPDTPVTLACKPPTSRESDDL